MNRETNEQRSVICNNCNAWESQGIDDSRWNFDLFRFINDLREPQYICLECDSSNTDSFIETID